MAKLSRDIRRQNRIRRDLKEKAADKCRLTVFRSSKHIYAQIIDDTSGKTIASASSLNKDFKEKGSDMNGASKVGAMIGEKAINAGIKEVHCLKEDEYQAVSRWLFHHGKTNLIEHDMETLELN